MVIPAEAWRPYAACKDQPVVMFFPERWETANPAREICASCPVQGACADYALHHRIEHGIWGGMNVRQRRRYRKAKNRKAYSL